MSAIPLRLGPLEAPPWMVVRSGVRWLREDGQLCKRGDVLGYCNIGLAAVGSPDARPPFAEESRDFQVAFLAPTSGRLRKANVSFGGFLDRHEYFQRWNPETLIGQLEFRPGERPANALADTDPQLLLLAGRRVTLLA
ncbi:MAG: hypothetical protein JO349_04485, partial [Candidatus Eremiobacteraeota bacterium]|nr:hypothetical protein [Candidatus Eremiobacteraeota bacterium]